MKYFNVKLLSVCYFVISWPKWDVLLSFFCRFLAAMTLNQSWGWLTNWENHTTQMWVGTYLDHLWCLSAHWLEWFYTDNDLYSILRIYLYWEAVWRMISASKHLHFMQSFAVFVIGIIGCTCRCNDWSCRCNDWSLHSAQRHTFWGRR